MTRTQVIGRRANWRTTINGVSHGLPDDPRLADAVGRRSSPTTTCAAMRKVAVIGATVADNLFPGRRPGRIADADPQRAVRHRRRAAKKGQNAGGQDQDDIVIIPYTTAQTRSAGSTRIGQILVSATSPQDIAAAQDEVRAIMRESHKIPRATTMTSRCGTRRRSRTPRRARRRS